MKTLMTKDRKEFVVINSDIPEGYGFSTIPRLLADTTTMEALKSIYPSIPFDKFDLVDVELKIMDI